MFVLYSDLSTWRHTGKLTNRFEYTPLELNQNLGIDICIVN